MTFAYRSCITEEPKSDKKTSSTEKCLSKEKTDLTRFSPAFHVPIMCYCCKETSLWNKQGPPRCCDQESSQRDSHHKK